MSCQHPLLGGSQRSYWWYLPLLYRVCLGLFLSVCQHALGLALGCNSALQPKVLYAVCFMCADTGSLFSFYP